MGNCCGRSNKSRYAGYKSDLGAPLLKKVIDDLPTGSYVYVIKLFAAHKLPAADITGLADPYFEFCLKPADKVAGDQSQHSSHIPRTINPQWEPPERFQFIATKAESSRIIISAYSYRSARDPQPLGDAVVLLKDFQETPVHKKVKLINPNNGKVEVEISKMDVIRANSVQEHTVYEFQRWQPIVEWGNDFPGHLLPTDPGKWSSGTGDKFGMSFESVEPVLPEGWEVVTPWYITLTAGDAQGWQYSYDFSNPAWHPEQSVGMCVRRRLWRREVAASR